MIRKLLKKDFDIVYELGLKLHPNYKIINDLEEIINNDLNYFYVYEKDNMVVGFIHYTKLYNSVDLVDIIVSEEYQNQMIGSTLIDFMITNLSADNKIYLEVNTNNKKAINLYQKFGFKVINIRKNYYGLDDAYVMERVI